MSKFEFITHKIEDGVDWVVLNRPEIHNAFNDKMIAELTECFDGISKRADSRLAVLTGEGKSFCAGADLNWMKSMVEYSMEENIQDSQKLAALFKAVNECTCPVIGKINGHALGGGVGLVSVCDYVIASNRAKYGFTEVKLGLIPAVISPYVMAKIGHSHARAWFLSGELFKSDRAYDLGFVHQVCDLEELDEKTNEVIQSFLKAGPIAAKEAKKLIFEVSKRDFQKSIDQNVEEYTCKAIANRRVSDEGQEGMSALLEKREATWLKK